ncbi:hypothetical protein [Mucilaginibacter agri]|uniref:Uncharacterized protein n=1 Tax=Mucilaginibacter agri TaxID=2695265 RepID=A0A965ZE97_9SPHI|nr:hypothetical protein [Mucilaginibacter agri]NCD68623.1 hypothetical protein [Mucilaginibacter agri]
MKTLILSSALVLASLAGFSQSSKPKTYYVDGVKVTEQQANKIKPDNLVSVQIGVDGVYFTTRNSACNLYWTYFKSKSEAYAAVVPALKDIYKVQYIINGTILTSAFDNTLANVNDANLVSIDVIEQDELTKQYGISDKPYGVIIKTKKVTVKGR